MGRPRLIPLAIAVLTIGVQTIASDSAAQTNAPASRESSSTVDASRVMLPCTPVAAYWTGSPPAAGMPPGPELAVVSVKVRPKDARVHLDGRFVGRARYLDGKPGYLYLEPGKYNFELRLDGYRTVLVELDATVSCRYDLKHRMERASGFSSEPSDDSYGRGEPFDRVFSPQKKAGPEVAAFRGSRPDEALRKDLERKSSTATGAVKTPGASFRLKVKPESASVSIDGVFVATARELALMEGDLATTAGKHSVVVSASGYVPVSQVIQLANGEALELDITLSEIRTN
jgi:hypothetical protein